MKKTCLSIVCNGQGPTVGKLSNYKPVEIAEGGVNYHSIFEQATDAIMVTDFDGYLKDVNSGLCALFGYAKKELLGLNVNILLQPEHLKSNPLRFDLLAIGENIIRERQMIHKNGTVIYVESNAKKISDNLVLAIARNVTERKKAENILQKTEANLRTIFDNTDTIYVLLDNHLRIISYNPRAYNFSKNELGHSIQTSEYFLDYFPVEKRPLLFTYMQKVLKGRPIKYEVSYPQPGGLLNCYHVRMFPISNGNNKIYGLMMGVSDVTENRLLENKLLEQKVQEQKKITRAIIKGQEKERTKIGQELHDNVNQILASSRMCLSSALNRKTIQKEWVEKSTVLIDAAIQEIRMLCMNQITPHGKLGLKDLIQLQVNLLNENASIKTKFDYHVAGHLIDPDLKLNIYRMIQEQVNNIIKHAQASTVKIELDADEQFIYVRIEDDGKGFHPQKKRKGIGITNMVNRVESFNGEFCIKSSPGKGCELSIKIPK
ncbi:MAG: PAS domain S-box protein [Ginsengibacter sp.]